MSDLSRQAGLLTLADFVRFSIKTLIGIALARILSPADLGTYRQLFLIYGTLSGILLLGFPQSLLYYIPKSDDPEKTKRLISRTLHVVSFLAVLCALIIFCSRSFIAHSFNNPDLQYLLIPYSIYPLLLFVTQMYSSILLGLKQPLKSATFSIFAISCDFVLVLGSALIFRDMRYIVAALIVSALLQWLWAEWGLRSLKAGWSLQNYAGFKEQLAYTIPLGLSLLVGVLSVQLDKLMISGFFKPEEFAVFSLGALELPLIGILINSVNAVLLPNMSSSSKADMAAIFSASVRKNSIIVFPLATVFFIFATEFMFVIYGAIYVSSALYFKVYLLILPLRVATYGLVFQALGKTKLVMLDSLIMLILNVILNYILIRTFGMVGAAIATVIVSWFIVLVYLFQMRYCMGLKLLDMFPLQSILTNLCAALLPVFVVVPVSGLIPNSFLRMTLGGTIYMLLYYGIARILRVIKPYDLELGRSIISGILKRGRK
ncbi:MAG: oligosaccharide flippase family protein [Candidatus Cloacimonetes bacterium]|jgi:O-antigen/teichoic acid export membrane protein|nr:oligosaccharide flippase family protein [Candidatus Cloacimonadota bacterium]MDD2506331.1 oligosaccharide flippase family protein [Candidatus Cloacimonadota bacterium]MDD4147371.1 oligosaccharide flippase family protein [Candidatus Cloacimonadota bacterium]MDD4560101.1 oligosaccharide flippase family protein [Candidatus Cloacimonadota bacterium]